MAVAPVSRIADADAVVIKLGGDVLEGAPRATVAADIQSHCQSKGPAFNSATFVVHGGGAQATALGNQLGLVARTIDGRRITDAAMLDVMKMAVAGRVNVDLVSALRAAGCPAFGLSGSSGVVRAHRRPPRLMPGAGLEPIDFGWVGDIDGFDLPVLHALVAAGRVPVLACLGADDCGQVLNINADTVASQLAAALHARALVAVTAVGGVRRDKNDPSTRIPRLTMAEAKAAIADGTVQGGMIPKLEEAFAPLAAGVAAVHIVAPGEIAQALAAPGSVGTCLRAD